ncbi:MAG: PaaI family thioesterase [Alphaproteobacteria bacterium]|nr:PaaI family thioesterase [Alphaproteobacteria bacterium]
MSASEDLAALLEAVPYARFLGVRLGFEEERLTASLPFAESLIGNPLLPALHGGVIGALLEIAAIGALCAEIGLEPLPKAITFTIEYRRSGRPVATRARASVTKLGRNVANVSANAWQDDETRPIAIAHGHFLLGQARENTQALLKPGP